MRLGASPQARSAGTAATARVNAACSVSSNVLTVPLSLFFCWRGTDSS
ncbi:hypothetical protein WJ973_23960 [Achromobacter xylosoxidans]